MIKYVLIFAKPPCVHFHKSQVQVQHSGQVPITLQSNLDKIIMNMSFTYPERVSKCCSSVHDPIIITQQQRQQQSILTIPMLIAPGIF